MAEKWLVIDDSATIQRVIKIAFQDYDVSITEADSVQDALGELTRSPSSLVIADAALAGVQSVQDFSRLQQASPNSAFVILEGSYDHIDETQLRGAGFRYFLKKPFDAQQLIAVTREALGRPIPHRFDSVLESTRPPPAPNLTHAPGPAPFSLGDDGVKAPPPPPGLSSRSLDEELENPFGADSGFDLGLDTEPEPPSRFNPAPNKVTIDSPFAASYAPDELEEDPFTAGAVSAKPYHPDPDSDSISYENPQPTSFRPEDSYSRGRAEPSFNPTPLAGMLEPMLREEMEKIVRQTVEEYCRKNFADLAREYLSREIEKLSQERSRLLVDK